MENLGPMLCGIVLDQTLQLNILANSKQNLKYFRVLILGPRG
jgi:hypothetical protein